MLSSSGPGTTNLRDLNDVNNRPQKASDSEEENDDDYENDADFNGKDDDDRDNQDNNKNAAAVDEDYEF